MQGVAGKAERVAVSLALSSEVLVAAAWLHDIGYAPDIVATGFHPLDGARYLAGLGAPTCRESGRPAFQRDLGSRASRDRRPDVSLPGRGRGTPRCLVVLRFDDFPGWLSGQPADRIAEIKERYGAGHIVSRFITDGAPELLAAVERTEYCLAGVLTD